MAQGIHTEQTFEEAIEAALLENGGYQKGSSTEYDADLGLFSSYITNFLKDSQPTTWEKISKIHSDEVETKIVQRLIREIDLRGALDVIRNGFTDYGVKFKMAFFRPESSLNPDAEVLYQTNHLSVTRQLYYERNGKNSLDLVLSLNGLPIATIELKNQFSGQNVNNAKKQYVFDREPTEPIFQFKKRALVHFAVDTDECYMTTKLAGKKPKNFHSNMAYKKGVVTPPTKNGNKKQNYWKYVWQKIVLWTSLPSSFTSTWKNLKLMEFARKKKL